jgi:hypothetical protein
MASGSVIQNQTFLWRNEAPMAVKSSPLSLFDSLLTVSVMKNATTPVAIEAPADSVPAGS